MLHVLSLHVIILFEDLQLSVLSPKLCTAQGREMPSTADVWWKGKHMSSQLSYISIHLSMTIICIYTHMARVAPMVLTLHWKNSKTDQPEQWKPPTSYGIHGLYGYQEPHSPKLAALLHPPKVIATWWPSGRLGMSVLSPQRGELGSAGGSISTRVWRTKPENEHPGSKLIQSTCQQHGSIAGELLHPVFDFHKTEIP